MKDMVELSREEYLNLLSAAKKRKTTDINTNNARLSDTVTGILAAGIDMYQHVNKNYTCLSNALQHVGIRNMVLVWETLVEIKPKKPFRVGTSIPFQTGNLGNKHLDISSLVVFSKHSFEKDNYLFMPCMCKEHLVALLILDMSLLTNRQYELPLIEFLHRMIGQSWALTIAFKHAYDVTTYQVNNDEKMGISSERKMQIDVPSFKPLQVCMIDIDKFKAVNDTYGHPVGDDVLAYFGSVLAKHSSRAVTPYRKGGDEVIVLSNDAEILNKYVAAVLNELRSKVFTVNNTTKFSVTISVGGALNCSSFELGLTWADYNLYQVKHSGRNHAIIAPCKTTSPPPIKEEGNKE